MPVRLVVGTSCSNAFRDICDLCQLHPTCFWPITAGGCVRGLDANLQEMACWSQHIAISSAMHRSAEFAMHDFLKNCNGPRKPYNVAKEGVTNRMCSLYFVRCYAAGASYFANFEIANLKVIHGSLGSLPMGPGVRCSEDHPRSDFVQRFRGRTST